MIYQKTTLSTILALVFLYVSAQKQFITIDDSQLMINMIGIENRKNGEPVIVFENGHTETIDTWDKIIEIAAEKSPVFLYDRAGTGASESDGAVPTLRSHADKLKGILNALEIPPPYLLVGHSLGAIYIRAYANYYPDDLAGLIFIDPPDFTQNLQDFATPFREIGVSTHYIDSMMHAKFGTSQSIDSSGNIKIQQERLMLRDLRMSNFKEIKIKSLPPLPVHFLVGGRFSVPPEFQTRDYDQESLFRARTKHWLENWVRIVNESPYGHLFYSANAGHYVQKDDPQLVISSIRMAINDYQKIENFD